MTRSSVIAALRKLAVSLGSVASGTEWHLFGSLNRGCPDASDIDLMIFCENDIQADLLRLAIDTDSLSLPLHLSLLTFEEATSINAAALQHSTVVLQVPPRTCPKTISRTDA
ncbi:nucleotidyltransferase domain-containing protein [Burkholderia pseudomallei]|uniref:nucleotidyltransferase domain-containing protein n=1 Tax=Burkholderia pseudomallei TaxID=28450 RepID=UPI0035C8427E